MAVNIAQVGVWGLTDRLLVEYCGALTAGVIIRLVARTRRELSRTGSQLSLDVLESAVRHRLAERIAADRDAA